MCLDTIDKETKQVTEGWKIFNVYGNDIISIYRTYWFEPNKWIKDPKHKTLITDSNKPYPSGFHFYFSKEDAEENAKRITKLMKLLINSKFKINFKIFKVKVKNIVATGTEKIISTDLEYRVGVAREIFIEEEPCV